MFDNNNEELSEEGQQLWNMIGINPDRDENEDMQGIITGATMLVRGKRKMPVMEKNMRIELKKLIQNSCLVIRDCELQIAYHTKRENYFKANEAKVALTIHINLIDRITTILNGSRVFSKAHEKLLSETDSDLIDLSDSTVM